MPVLPYSSTVAKLRFWPTKMKAKVPTTPHSPPPGFRMARTRKTSPRKAILRIRRSTNWADDRARAPPENRTATQRGIHARLRSRRCARAAPSARRRSCAELAGSPYLPCASPPSLPSARVSTDTGAAIIRRLLSLAFGLSRASPGEDEAVGHREPSLSGPLRRDTSAYRKGPVGYVMTAARSRMP